MQPILLYDLAAADGRRFSPYCWRAKMALAHKGLAVTTVPTPFTAIPAIGGGSQTTVPVIVDGERVVRDSFAIAEYLDQAYPDRPALFDGAGGRAAARFVDSWANSLHGLISRIVLLDIHDRLVDADKVYFRESRERRFGMPLEKIVEGREGRIGIFRDALLPMRLMLRTQPWIGGAAPNFSDYIVFGTLQWPLGVTTIELVAEDDPLRAWLDRCLDLNDGFARKGSGPQAG